MLIEGDRKNNFAGSTRSAGSQLATPDCVNGRP